MRTRRQAAIGAAGVALAMSLSVLSSAPPAFADTPAIVPDANLVTCLNASVNWNRPSDTPLTVGEIANVTSLYCDGVDDLTGIELATSKLVTLQLHDGKITSLDKLSGLTGLTDLRVSSFFSPDPVPPIADLTPLDQMTNLTSLIIGNTPTTALPNVKDMPHLKLLLLGNTRISDLTPLAGHPSLSELYLDGSLVADLTPLASLPTLTALTLVDAPVSDISPLASLSALSIVNLDRTHVSDLLTLSSLNNLTELTFNGTQVSDLRPLATLDTLSRLSLNDTPVDDLSPLAGLTALDDLSLMRTKVTSVKPLAGTTGLQRLVFTSSPVSSLDGLSDLSELGWVRGNGAEIIDASMLGENPSAELEDQHVNFGQVTAGVTVANPLRGFDGESIVPATESLTAAHATISADSNELVFSTPGTYTLSWSNATDGSGSEFSRTFSGTIDFTVVAPTPTNPPTSPPTPPAPPAPPVAPAAVLAETGFDLAGLMLPAAFLLVAAGLVLMRRQRRA